MCLAIYIASDIELSTSKWDKNSPSFYSESIEPNKHYGVDRHFSKPYVYYLGSHEGCGCGFMYDDNNIQGTSEQALLKKIRG